MSNDVPRSESPTGSPRSASTSLQAAASMNAGLRRESSRDSSSRASPQSGRRRSILMNLHINDPSIPGPGEMADSPGQSRRQSRRGSHSHSAILSSPYLQPSSPSATADPHHHRAPSLGELHQELEAEQEAHVNRLLQMIRQQQLELQRLQASNPANQADAAAAGGSGSAGASAAVPIPAPVSATPGSAGSYSRSPSLAHHHHRRGPSLSASSAAARSRTPSRGPSPRLRATSISAESGDWALAGGGGGRDESALYQAETQMLTRENQMLRHRIRELEKQLSDMSASPASQPQVPSHLTQSTGPEDKEQ